MFVALFFLLAVLQSTGPTMAYSIYEVREKAETEGDLSLQTLSSAIRGSLSSTMPIPWDLLESVYSGESLPVNEIVQFELPVLIPAAIGILLALLVLIVTPIFCCCRCCCKCCGAKLAMSDIRKQKRCYLFVTVVFVLFSVSLISLTAFSSLESGVRFRKSPRMIFDTVDSSLTDLPAYITNFGKDMLTEVKLELNVTLAELKARVEDLPNILSAPLTGIAGSAMAGVNNHLQTLQTGIANITSIETDTNTTVDSIKQHTQNLGNVIDLVNNNLTAIKAKCTLDGETFCHLLLEPSSNTADFNVTELSDLSSSVRDLVSEINSVNLTEIQHLGNESLTKMPEVIHNSSKTAVSGVVTELDKIPGTVLPELDKVLEFTNMSRSSLGFDQTADSFRSIVDQYDALTSPLIDKTVLPIVSSYMGVIALLAFLGLVLGVACSRRGNSSTTRSRLSHVGASCLICTVGLAVLPVVMFMLLGPVLLVVGGNLSIFCGPIQDLTLIGKLDNGYLGIYSAESLNDSLGVNISLKHFFQTCKRNGTVYDGLNLSDKFNLSSYINASSFVPELGSDVYDSINETIQDMNVLNTDLVQNMTSSFTFTNITNNSTTQSIKDELDEFNLTEWSANLSSVASQIPSQFYADAYTDLAQVLVNLDINEKGPLLQDMDSINNITIKLLDMADKLQNSSEAISQELGNLQQFIQNQAIDSIFATIQDFLDNMTMVPVSFIDALTRKMSDDIGHCGILWDIYDGITASFCGYLLDSLTVYWLSLYIGGFAMVILMLASCTVGKYFRKPDDMLSPRSYQNMSANAMPGGVESRVLKNDTNNNIGTRTALPDWCYRVVKKKQHKRRRHCQTGDQSPQLINIRMLRESLRNTTVFGNDYNKVHENKGNTSISESSPLIKAGTNYTGIDAQTPVMYMPRMTKLIPGDRQVEGLEMDVQSPYLKFYTEDSDGGNCKSNEGFQNSLVDMETPNEKSTALNGHASDQGGPNNIPRCTHVANTDTYQDSDNANVCFVLPNVNKENHSINPKQPEIETKGVRESIKPGPGHKRWLPAGSNKVDIEKDKLFGTPYNAAVTDRYTSSPTFNSFGKPRRNKLLDNKYCGPHSVCEGEQPAVHHIDDSVTNKKTEHLHYIDEMSRLHIQCALCKNRNKARSEAVFDSDTDNKPVTLSDNLQNGSMHGSSGDGGRINIALSQESDNLNMEVDETANSLLDVKPSYSLVNNCGTCKTYLDNTSVRNTVSYDREEPLNEVLSEFNVVYTSLASPRDYSGHGDTPDRETNIDFTMNSKEISTGISGTHRAAESRGKKVLRIQVKPYRDLYTDKDYRGTSDGQATSPVHCTQTGTEVIERRVKSPVHSTGMEMVELRGKPTDVTNAELDMEMIDRHRARPTVMFQTETANETRNKHTGTTRAASNTDTGIGWADRGQVITPIHHTEAATEMTDRGGRPLVVETQKNQGKCGGINTKPRTPISALSQLATNAAFGIAENADKSRLPTEFGLMTASCGQGHEKTTYL